MVKKIINFLSIILVITGCSYSVRSNAYPHLRRLQILAFENRSTEFTLGDIVINRLSASFRDDGRLRLVTLQPDCQIDGSIVSFREKIHSFDAANNVQDYIVSISFSITFTDLQKNQVLYENKTLILSEIYKVSAESTSRFESKEDAINEICEKLFKNIIQNTLESW